MIETKALMMRHSKFPCLILAVMIAMLLIYFILK